MNRTHSQILLLNSQNLIQRRFFLQMLLGGSLALAAHALSEVLPAVQQGNLTEKPKPKNSYGAGPYGISPTTTSNQA